MKKHLSLLTISLLCLITVANSQTYGLVLHGGAGTITKAGLSKERQNVYETGLQKALDAGYFVLDEGGNAEDAVIAAIRILEDDSNFNSARGSVLNANGAVEMDASIMKGVDLNAGAVAGVTTVRHPIEAATKVMLSSPHVMMSNAGADLFAKEQGLEIMPTSYFITKGSQATLKGVQDRLKEQGSVESEYPDWKFGTVGVAALDKQGNLAAGTSTGGMTNKMHNRIGDSPIIGAGTYANNKTCAVSCTGHGEYFIRLNLAHEVSALMLYKGYDVEKAASFMIHKSLSDMGGSGGLVAMDRKGHISMPFNTPGMFRAYQMSDGRKSVLMFKDEE
ncbi:MAG: isoaspartyl peptidase/L-asparaginase [Flavobacteriales bacterium]|nr:isoaspartyl peptidase/L-asparaginase [Flavobacteriales bacterium]